MPINDAMVNWTPIEDDEAKKRKSIDDRMVKWEPIEPPAAVRAGASLNDIPRQLGLTARYGLEGLAGTAQIATEPLRYLTDRLTGNVGKTKPLGALASDAADWLGLPKPQGANERVVAEATKMLAGSGGLAGGASLLSRAPGALGSAAEFLAANPTQQLGSAVGAGLAGGASREAGGNGWTQALASLVGGVGGGMGATAAQGITNAAKTVLTPSMSNPQMDAKISVILSNAGVDYSQVPERMRQALRSQMADSLKVGDEFSPAAVSRLLDFSRVGATPTRGMLSQNPVQITREQNLAKIGANSSDTDLHGLPMIQNQNNSRLIGALNEAGAATGDKMRAGTSALDRINAIDTQLKGIKDNAYQTLEGMPGYKQPISPIAVSNINKALGDEAAMPFMPKEISNYMESFITQGQPFTPQAYNNLQKMLAGAATSQDGNVRNAVRIASQTLEATPIVPLNNSSREAADAIAQLQAARSAHRDWRTWQESTPPIRAALNDAQPDNFVQKFVIGGSVRDAKSIADSAGKDEVKNAILAHLKEKAISGSADEFGKFSQAAYNKALMQFGTQKLSIFFSPEEITQLRSVGRVASAIQVQPVGSAVNNSNSGALMVGKAYDAIKNGIGMIPGIGPTTAGMIDLTLGNPTKSAYNWMGQRAAQKIKPGLLMDQEDPSLYQSMLLPGVAMGGLLSSP